MKTFMSKHASALLLTLLVSACAAPTPQDIRDRAARASNIELCQAMMYGNPTVATIAGQEASQRSLDCRPYMGAIAQDQQARRAAADQAMNYFIQRTLPGPPPSPIPHPQYQCRSRWVGNQLETICN